MSSRIDRVFGLPWSMASALTLKLTSSWVCLKRLLITTLGMASRFSSMTSRQFSSDSLRMALMSVMTLVFTRSAICSSSAARLTLKGISVITSCSRFPFICSIPTLPRSFTLPRPVSKYLPMPSMPQRMPPVGKSGPLMNFCSWALAISGLSICAQMPSMTSARLCGAMLVAMPTAMPVPPLTIRFGNAAGNTVGSVMRSS